MLLDLHHNLKAAGLTSTILGENWKMNNFTANL